MPRRAEPLRQRVVSLDGNPVRSGTGRPVSVDGALSLRSVKAGDVLLVPGLSAVSERAIERLLSRDDTARVLDLLARASAKGAVVAASSATIVTG